MAVSNTTSNSNSAKRRLFFGANVVVMTVLAVMVLVGVNLLGHFKNSRWDLSGGLSGHRLSDRTKSILDQPGVADDLRITTVYDSDDPETARKEFFPRVEDLCEEVRQYKKSVKIDHLITGNDQAVLRDRVQEKFGSAAGAYDEVVTLARDVWSELDGLLRPQQQMIAGLLAGESWLSGFTTLANIATIVQKDLKNIEETSREVDDLVRGQGIPRYSEANKKIKQANTDLKTHLEQIQDWTRQMNKLVEVLGNPDAEFVKTTRAKLGELAEQLAGLQKITGDPADTNVPEDPKSVLQAFAKAALNLSQWLADEFSRVNQFASEYPAIGQHPAWRIQQAIFTMELPVLLNSAGDDLGKNARELRRILAQGDKVPLDQLQSVVRQLRTITVQMQNNLGHWSESILGILEESQNVDAKSKEFLVRVSSGEMLSAPLDKLNEVSTKITELPELKLDEVAKGLQAENIIVVEKGDKVRVVTFDETWPVADRYAGMMGDEDAPPPRVFDGDSAISNALMSMVSDEPIAKVVFVTFEEQIPPQMRQFRQPVMGPMPMEALRVLREKLEAMNFEVEDWNLAEEGARNNPPTVDEGTQVIYVFLPPPPPPSMMFQQQQQQKRFTPADAEVARKVLSQPNARGLFLAMWMAPNPFGPPPQYAWGPILEEDWGIHVDVPRRVIRGVVDRKRPGHYALDIVQWYYMQLSSFTEHAIGYPLRARRMLMKDVCPVVAADDVPTGVEIDEVLDVPVGTTDIWAEGDVRHMFKALQEGSEEGTFTRSDQAMDPPFSMMLAAVKQMADEAKNESKDSAETQPAVATTQESAPNGKVVVMGNALSLRDDFLEQRVVRFGGKGTRLVTDPPPMENVDLFVNALYWLADRDGLIAAGPVEVPVVSAIDEQDKRSLLLVTAGWALAALIAGAVMMFVRRK